jgi:hypothetical protein
MKTLLDDSALSVISSSYVLELHAPGTIEQIARNSLHAIYDFVPSITRPPLLSLSTKSVDVPPSFSYILLRKGPDADVDRMFSGPEWVVLCCVCSLPF